LAAWDAWQRGEEGWTALAVYLIAAHHGKVRTVLRSTEGGDDVFGVRPEAILPPLPGWVPAALPLDLRPRAFGAVGAWDDAGERFTSIMPSWVGVVAELLGPELPGDPAPCAAVPVHEPRGLGPFRLAFLEALVRAADARASRWPGRGDVR
jgi:CRISPR-associated endonuclease/helicase Cas3